MNLDNFLHQSFLVFALPTLLVVTMTTGLCIARCRKLKKGANFAIQSGKSSTTSGRNLDTHPKPSCTSLITKTDKRTSFMRPVDRRIRQTIYLLIAIIVNFFICIVPQMSLMTFLRCFQLLASEDDYMKVFEKVCGFLNATGVLTCLGHADHLILFALANTTAQRSFKRFLNTVSQSFGGGSKRSEIDLKSFQTVALSNREDTDNL